MKTIEEAAMEYDNSISYEGDAIREAFIAGVEFAQRWIPVEEEPYPSHTQILVKTKNGSVYDVMHNSHDNKVTSWWGSGQFELYQDIIVSWRPINRK